MFPIKSFRNVSPPPEVPSGPAARWRAFRLREGRPRAGLGRGVRVVLAIIGIVLAVGLFGERVVLAPDPSGTRTAFLCGPSMPVWTLFGALAGPRSPLMNVRLVVKYPGGRPAVEISARKLGDPRGDWDGGYEVPLDVAWHPDGRRIVAIVEWQGDFSVARAFGFRISKAGLVPEKVGPWVTAALESELGRRRGARRRFLRRVQKDLPTY